MSDFTTEEACCSEVILRKDISSSSSCAGVFGGDRHRGGVVRILCYGDSLTHGLVPGRIGTEQRFPWAPDLEEVLNSMNAKPALAGCPEGSDNVHSRNVEQSPYREEASEFARDADCQHGACSSTSSTFIATALGFPGCCSGELLDILSKRWPFGFDFEQDKKYTFEVAIVMAGTNDIGSFLMRENKQQSSAQYADEIVSNLQRIHHAFQHDYKVQQTIVVCIPQSKASAPGKLLSDLRTLANQKIKDAFGFREERCPEDARNTYNLVVDMDDVFSFKAEPELWSKDGLHFSKLGYAEFGRRLARKIKDFVNDLRTP